jgi:hypothetical protein
MLTISQPFNWAFRRRVMAVALGLSGLLQVHAQQPSPSAKYQRNAADSSDRRPDLGLSRSKLKGLLFEQRKAALQANVAYNNARLAREIAEIGIEQYFECNFPQELATADAEIKQAESDLKRAEDRLEWVRNNSYKGFPPDGSVISGELNVKKASFALQQALSKKKVLVNFKKDKRVKELKGEVDTARSNEVAKKAAWALEKLKESAIEQQMAQWQVMVANCGEMKGPSSRSVRGAFRKEARAVVREIPIRQLATGVRSARSGSAGLPVMARGVAEPHAAGNETRG